VAEADMEERIADLAVAVNVLLRKKGAAGLEVRVEAAGPGRLWVRTVQVDPDGARRTRQESPELPPDQALAYLQKLMDSLRKA
jgi:hypothetical protein